MGALSERIYSLDYIRAVAIIGVVIVHTFPSEVSPWFDPVWRALTRAAVPLFVMLSGALILERWTQRELSMQSVWSFYKKKLPRFLGLLVLWSVLTSAVKSFACNYSSLTDALLYAIRSNGIYNGHSFLQFSVADAGQLWYMYEIVLLYILAPFIGRTIASCRRSWLTYLMLICGALFLFLKTDLLPLSSFLCTRVCFVLYFVFGYYARCLSLEERPRVVAVSAFAALCAFLWIVLQYADNDNVWYKHCSVVVFSTSLYICLLRFWRFSGRCAMVESLSKCSFGIYLNHLAVKLLLLACLAKLNIPFAGGGDGCSSRVA